MLRILFTLYRTPFGEIHPTRSTLSALKLVCKTYSGGVHYHRSEQVWQVNLNLTEESFAHMQFSQHSPAKRSVTAA